jgi:phosphoribosyl-AMP cyclohydrolase
MGKELEEGNALALDYNKLAKAVASSPGIIPVAVQNADTNEIILVAYVNELALKKSLEVGEAVFWSTSRNELWHKGMESGNSFELVDVRVNCEQNSLLYRVRPKGGGMCHTKNKDGQARSGCYYRRLNRETGRLENLEP